MLKAERPQTVTVRAEDDPFDLTKPRGKQDWQLEPHSIWYPRTTGIWQTVWLERCPTYIDKMRWTPIFEGFEIGSRRASAVGDPTTCRSSGAHARRPAAGRRPLQGGRTARRPQDRAVRPRHRRFPQRAAVEPRAADAAGREAARCATATRSSTRSVVHRAALGQRSARPLHAQRPPVRAAHGAGPGLLARHAAAAPSDDALRRDVELAKAMGFNGVRKHQKIEDPRYLYWADKLGLLVWEEMPSAYRFTRKAIKRMVREWTEAIDRDYSHPCIIVWVPFNESWGVPNLPSVQAHRHAVEALYHLTKTLDRPRAGDRQRRLGIVGHRHHRHPRLRLQPRAHPAALRHRRGDRAAVRPAPPGRPRADAGRLSRTAASPSC
jgi:hypothetical protein